MQTRGFPALNTSRVRHDPSIVRVISLSRSALDKTLTRGIWPRIKIDKTKDIWLEPQFRALSNHVLSHDQNELFLPPPQTNSGENNVLQNRLTHSRAHNYFNQLKLTDQAPIVYQTQFVLLIRNTLHGRRVYSRRINSFVSVFACRFACFIGNTNYRVFCLCEI